MINLENAIKSSKVYGQIQEVARNLPSELLTPSLEGQILKAREIYSQTIKKVKPYFPPLDRSVLTKQTAEKGEVQVFVVKDDKDKEVVDIKVLKRKTNLDPVIGLMMSLVFNSMPDHIKQELGIVNLVARDRNILREIVLKNNLLDKNLSKDDLQILFKNCWEFYFSDLYEVGCNSMLEQLQDQDHLHPLIVASCELVEEKLENFRQYIDKQNIETMGINLTTLFTKEDEDIKFPTNGSIEFSAQDKNEDNRKEKSIDEQLEVLKMKQPSVFGQIEGIVSRLFDDVFNGDLNRDEIKFNVLAGAFNIGPHYIKEVAKRRRIIRANMKMDGDTILNALQAVLDVFFNQYKRKSLVGFQS